MVLAFRAADFDFALHLVECLADTEPEGTAGAALCLPLVKTCRLSIKI